DGGAIEFFARLAPAILGTNESFAAAGIDEKTSPMNCLFPALVARRDGHLVRQRSHIGIEDRSFLADIGAITGGIFQKDMIELAAQDLEREIALIIDHMVETPGGGDDAIAIDEADPGFADESFFQLAGNTELIEQGVAKGEERFADVFAREFFTFEEENIV